MINGCYILGKFIFATIQALEVTFNRYPFMPRLSIIIVFITSTLSGYAFCSQDTVDNVKAPISLFLSGDVMLGRGIDQILPHRNNPILYENWIRDAREYVKLAEQTNGPIRKPVDCRYIWGDALEIMDRNMPDARIINLETSVTSSDDAWKGKDIHYRMHPRNAECLRTAKISFASLANNHVLDWGYNGLAETLSSLEQAGIKAAGAGENWQRAAKPSLIKLPDSNRVLITAWASPYSGVPPEWKATEQRPGVTRLDRLDSDAVNHIASIIRSHKRQGDIAVFTIHWGSNWGYRIPREHIEFAHQLIDEAGIDVVHGHSSHHPMAIEVYRNKLIIHGSGDLLNDYEGIGGHQSYRPDLALMYFADIDPASGNLVKLQMAPVQIRNLRLNHADHDDSAWLLNMLNREGNKFGTKVKLVAGRQLELEWE